MEHNKATEPLDSLNVDNPLPVSSVRADYAAAQPTQSLAANFQLESESPPKGAGNRSFGAFTATEPAAQHHELAGLSNISLLDEEDIAFASSVPAVTEPTVAAAETATPVMSEPASLLSVQGSVGPLHEPAAAAAAAPASSREHVGTVPDIALHPQDTPIKVWVRNPERVEGNRIGFGSYVSYLLRTECSLGTPLFAGIAAPTPPAAADAGSHSAASGSGTPEAGSAARKSTASAPREGLQVFEVRRRFNDFEVLHKLLKSHYKGYFLPALPDKAFLDSKFGSDSFLKVRKVDLQAYMCTVANHPALQSSEELRVFLTFPGDLTGCPRWQAMVAWPAPGEMLLGLLNQGNRQDGSGPAGAGASGAGGDGGKLGGVMMRMKHSLMAVVQPKAPKPLAADEQQLRQAKEWFKELQQHLSACVAVVRSLVSHLEAAAEDFNDLGRTLSHMARYEEVLAARQGQYTPTGSAAVQRAADLQLLGYAALRQQAVDKQFVLRTGASLVFLHDYWMLVPEVVATLEEREDALGAVHLLDEELRDKQQAAAAAAAVGDKRLAGLNASIEALQVKLAAAGEHYQLLKERNQSELVRLNLQRAVDFRTALSRFAQVQAQLAQSCSAIWTGVAEQLAQ